MKPHGEVESMWDAAVAVFGGPRPAEEEAAHLTEETGVRHFHKRFTETENGSVYYHFGVYKED